MKKFWNIKISLVIEREYADKMTKKEAKEMALQDFYGDMRHGCFPTPKIELKEIKFS